MQRFWPLPALTLCLCVAVARADDQAEMKALVQKAIKAHGGAENLNKYTAVTTRSTGKLQIMGVTLAYTENVSFQEPDKLRSEVQFEFMGKNTTILTVFNGKQAWLQVNGKDMKLPADVAERVQEDLAENRIRRLTPLVDKAYTLSPLGEIMIDGKPAVGVRAERKGSPGANLYFDKETGLLVKSEMRMSDPSNPTEKINGETFFSDYRKVEGMMLPFKVVIKKEGKTIVEAEVREATPATKLDDNLFSKP